MLRLMLLRFCLVGVACRLLLVVAGCCLLLGTCCRLLSIDCGVSVCVVCVLFAFVGVVAFVCFFLASRSLLFVVWYLMSVGVLAVRC